MEPESHADPDQQQKFSSWELWPLAVAVLYCFVLNTTYLMGWMKAWEVPDRWYFLAAFLASQSEIGWWYWFFGWFGRSVAKAFAKMNFIQRWIQEFKLRGFPDRINWLIDQARPVVQDIWEAICDEFRELFDPPEGRRKRFFRWMLKFLQTTWRPVAYLSMFMLGAVPHFNILVGVPLARALGLGSLVALMAGNCITIYSSDKMVDLVFWVWSFLPGWARISVGIGLVLLIFTRHRRRKAARMKKAAP